MMGGLQVEVLRLSSFTWPFPLALGDYGQVVWVISLTGDWYEGSRVYVTHTFRCEDMWPVGDEKDD